MSSNQPEAGIFIPKTPAGDIPVTPTPIDVNWEQEKNSEVVYLSNKNFNKFLMHKEHAFVMFYSTRCIYCKRAKPEFTAAANDMVKDQRVVYAAVDCVKNQNLCNAYQIDGYPTFKYFSYLLSSVEYNGMRTRDDFVAFLRQFVADYGIK